MGRKVVWSDGTHTVLEGLPYAQITDAALGLSGPAYKMLGRLQRLAGPTAGGEIDDQELGQWIDRSRATVQRCWSELEAAGLAQRVRRGGRRRYMLLYTLAGREARTVRHACTTDEACNPQGRDMHAPTLRHPPDPPNRKRAREEQQQGTGPAGGVVALCPADPEEEGPPSRSGFLRSMVLDLADALGSKSGPAAGSSAKYPPRPALRQNIPVEGDCTADPAQESRGVLQNET